jgi:hypothetical protein
MSILTQKLRTTLLLGSDFRINLQLFTSEAPLNMVRWKSKCITSPHTRLNLSSRNKVYKLTQAQAVPGPVPGPGVGGGDGLSEGGCPGFLGKGGEPGPVGGPGV